jgi:5-methylcytosine-specific restriction endonuclease McrA
MIGHPKPRPSILDKREKQRDALSLKRRVYQAVDERDQRMCRCCGRKGNPESTTALGRIHRTHIRDASRGGALSTENIVLLCWLCHALEHAKQLHILGTDANEAIGFEMHEAAVVEVFGSKPLPPHVHIVTERRR